MVSSCGSHTKTQTYQTTTAKDSILVHQRIVVREGLNTQMVYEAPCDSIGRIKPFKQSLKSKGLDISLQAKDSSLVVTVRSDSLYSSSNVEYRTKEVIVEKEVYKEKIKYRVPKWIIYTLIGLGIYIAYRILRLVYPVLRFLPY
jgi:hypothetical protein